MTDKVYTEKRDYGVVSSPSMRHKLGKYIMSKMNRLLSLQNLAMEIGRNPQRERSQSFHLGSETLSHAVHDPAFVQNQTQSINSDSSANSAIITSLFLPQTMRRTSLDDAESRGVREVAEGCKEILASTLPSTNLHQGKQSQKDHKLELGARLSHTDSVTASLANSYHGRLPSTASNKSVVFRNVEIATGKKVYTRSFTWSGPLSMQFVCPSSSDVLQFKVCNAPAENNGANCHARGNKTIRIQYIDGDIALEGSDVVKTRAGVIDRKERPCGDGDLARNNSQL
jgi:hypothetical protein